MNDHGQDMEGHKYHWHYFTIYFLHLNILSAEKTKNIISFTTNIGILPPHSSPKLSYFR